MEKFKPRNRMKDRNHLDQYFPFDDDLREYLGLIDVGFGEALARIERTEGIIYCCQIAPQRFVEAGLRLLAECRGR